MECRIDCVDKLGKFRDYPEEDFFGSFFHYLQLGYYHCTFPYTTATCLNITAILFCSTAGITSQWDTTIVRFHIIPLLHVSGADPEIYKGGAQLEVLSVCLLGGSGGMPPQEI